MSGPKATSDLAVIGGGIVGLATAWLFQQRYPDQRLTLLEAESGVSRHQSGHNSGVLHSGLYYQPGSQKAICCREGKAAMEAFCSDQKISWDRCGKVVIATHSAELQRLDAIAERAEANGVGFARIDTDQLRALEPHAAGIAALHVPESGIVDYRQVCERLAELIRGGGNTIRLNYRVTSIKPRGNSLEIGSSEGDSITAGKLINCGGLSCDRIFRMAGGTTEIQIVPFRGEYYELKPASTSLCRNLIYPVPDPAFPFLGVHFTRMIGGGVECGPNAVLALAREGYRWSDIKLGDLLETIRFRGFRKLAAKHWRMGLGEMNRSLNKQAFVKALQKLIPDIRAEDLIAARAGVRAQAVAPDGGLVDDFLFAETKHAVHVLNAPSPAATASLAIGERIVDRLQAST